MSLTAVRNRMIDIAPTSPNARARLFPIAMMTTAVIMARVTSEATNVTE